MSDNIPLELQVEIIKRVPVKSLLQFRSVSKQWKSVIDSPDFAADYCILQSQSRLLIRYIPFEQAVTSIDKYVSVVDDDTLHQHQFPTAALPESLNDLKHSRVVGCSDGLVCFYAFSSDYKSDMAILWNPWIRKFVDVPVPNVLFHPYHTVLGFGVSPQTTDPMIVKVISSYFSPTADTSVPMPWRVEVFALSSGTWKTPSGSINNLPCRNSIRFQWRQVALDGVIYWLAFDWIKVDGRFQFHNLIMSFDLSSEGFQEICLPDNLACIKFCDLYIFKRMEYVVVLEMDETATFNSVWVMGLGVTKSFTKLFNIMPGVSRVYGFMKNGETIVEHESHALFVYDSHSGAIKDLGIVGRDVSFDVKSYMETLLLTGQ